MTGPIIPAELWPEGADRHCWDANEEGLFYGTEPDTGIWMECTKRSNIPMPTGWDWRVPVMRQPAIDRDRLLSALERAAAAETELARLRDQQQSPAIDLEQFREAVMRFKALAELGVDVESMPMHFMKSQEKYAADVVEADRLLALIDGQSVSEKPQKRRCPNNVAPGGCQLPNRFCTFPDCEKADKLLPTKGEGE